MAGQETQPAHRRLFSRYHSAVEDTGAGRSCARRLIRNKMASDLTRRQALKLYSGVLVPAILPGPVMALNGSGIDDFFQLDSISQAAMVKKGEVSPLELAEAAINRIEHLNKNINAVITPTFKSALAKARKGLPSGPLSGVPYLFKDLMDYKGHRTAFGSRATINHISDVTHPFGLRALEAGLNVLGKTNTPELGLLASTEPVAFGASRNPWKLNRSTGGSSGGSAAAVASGMVAAAQGSDGGGSLRVPASCCGIFALKPSRGRTVDDKLVEPWHISVKGHLTRTVRDSAALFALTEEKGADTPYPATGFVKRPLAKKLRIGLIMNGANGKKPAADVAAQIFKTAKLCENLGHELVETSFPTDAERLTDAFFSIWSSYAAMFKTSIEQQMGKPANGDILEPWTLYMDEYFHKQGRAHMEPAKSYFAEVTRNLDDLMNDHDVLLSPVLSTAAPELGSQGPLIPGDQLKEDGLNYVNYTPVYNISGQPAMSVPLGWNLQGLPVGSQFAARNGNEKLLFELAYQLEEARSWHRRWAPHSAAAL